MFPFPSFGPGHDPFPYLHGSYAVRVQPAPCAGILLGQVYSKDGAVAFATDAGTHVLTKLTAQVNTPFSHWQIFVTLLQEEPLLAAFGSM